MKNGKRIVVFALFALLLFNIILLEVAIRIVKAESQNTITLQLHNIGNGQSSITNQVLTQPQFQQTVIPASAQQGSGCMALYSFNKTLNTLKSFQVFTLYSNAVPICNSS
jgi:hypothetical protein